MKVKFLRYSSTPIDRMRSNSANKQKPEISRSKLVFRNTVADVNHLLKRHLGLLNSRAESARFAIYLLYKQNVTTCKQSATGSVAVYKKEQYSAETVWLQFPEKLRSEVSDLRC